MGLISFITNRVTAVDVSGLTSGVTSVSTNFDHTCALTSSGGVKCWGNNAEGQLGDGTTTDHLTPVDVSGLTSGVAAVSAGYSNTCVQTSSNGVKCWGTDSYGELGDGTTTGRLTPVDVSGLTSGVTSLSVNYNHCVLTNSDGAKCWGMNNQGQLGDGTQTIRLTSVDVFGLTSGVISVSAGGTDACAITASGGIKCWGENLAGAVGDGTTTRRLTPADVSGFTSGATSLSLSLNGTTCALTTSGGAKCWGSNNSGQVGSSSAGHNQLTPIEVTGYSD